MDVDTTLLPRERKLLEGFVSPATVWFRAGAFAILLMLFVGFVQLMMHWMLKDLFVQYHGLILLVLTLAFAILLYRTGGNWTGGRGFRAQIRMDLAEGHAVCEVHEVAKAIEVEGNEGKAPAYFLKLSDGRVMFIHGRENIIWKFRGFPGSALPSAPLPIPSVFWASKNSTIP